LSSLIKLNRIDSFKLREDGKILKWLLVGQERMMTKMKADEKKTKAEISHFPDRYPQSHSSGHARKNRGNLMEMKADTEHLKAAKI
jgi:hypothetical protein